MRHVLAILMAAVFVGLIAAACGDDGIYCTKWIVTEDVVSLRPYLKIPQKHCLEWAVRETGAAAPAPTERGCPK